MWGEIYTHAEEIATSHEIDVTPSTSRRKNVPKRFENSLFFNLFIRETICPAKTNVREIPYIPACDRQVSLRNSSNIRF